MRQIGMQLLPEVLHKFPDSIPHIGHQGITGTLHVNLKLYLWKRGRRLQLADSAETFKCVFQIGDQIVGIFNANGIPDQCFGNAAGRTLLARGLYVARSCGRSSNRFDRTKICSEMGIAQSWEKFLYRSETALQHEAENSTIPAHLTASDGVILMRFQARIINGCDL